MERVGPGVGRAPDACTGPHQMRRCKPSNGVESRPGGATTADAGPADPRTKNAVAQLPRKPRGTVPRNTDGDGTPTRIAMGASLPAPPPSSELDDVRASKCQKTKIRDVCSPPFTHLNHRFTYNPSREES
jgi:hypothetical protein